VYQPGRRRPEEEGFPTVCRTGRCEQGINDITDEALPCEEGALRRYLASLGATVLTQLFVVLMWPQDRRDAMVQLWMRRPDKADVARLISMADSDDSMLLLVLQVIRDILT
jgi:hypothetical protein